MRASLNKPSNKIAGFSMIELLIVLLLVGGMFKVGMSSYSDFLNRNTRAEVTAVLERLAAQQEEYFKRNDQYARNISKLAMEPLTESGNYLLSVSGKWNAYVLQADPDGSGTTGKMATDGKFRLNSDGVKSWDCDNDGSYRCDWKEATGK